MLIITLPDFEALSEMKTNAAARGYPSVVTGGCVRLEFSSDDRDESKLRPFERYSFNMTDAVAYDCEFAVPLRLIHSAFQSHGWLHTSSGSFLEFVDSYFAESCDADLTGSDDACANCRAIAGIYSFLVLTRVRGKQDHGGRIA